MVNRLRNWISAVSTWGQGGPVGFAILQENSSRILLENGDYILLE
jgi:hypothetical protein